MKHWEFLLQREGDRSWLPLDPPTVEILEGRYRIVVRSSRRDAPVEVRICHLDPDANPPKRRTQKRTRRTNADGLMVLIPYTRLQPGIWDLQCSLSDLMTELVEGGSQYAVQLHVLACESEADLWQPDDVEPAVAATRSIAREPAVAEPTEVLAPIVAASFPSTEPIAPAVSEAVPMEEVEPSIEPSAEPAAIADFETEMTELLKAAPSEATQNQWFYLTEELSEQLMNEILGDLDLSDLPEAIVQSQPANSSHPVATLAAAVRAEIPVPRPVSLPSSYALQLDQTAIVASASASLKLSGRAEVGSDPIDAELHLYLRDPQSMQVLVSDRQALPTADPIAGNAAFCFTFRLPTRLATRLVVGEVVLVRQFDGQAADPIAPLASQPFTITVDPEALVQELTQLPADREPEEMGDRGFFSGAAKQENANLELSFLNLVSTTQSAPPHPEPAALHLSFLNLNDPADRIAPPRFESLAGQPLPPQLYQPDPTQAKHKPVKLPSFGLSATPIAPAVAATEPATEPPDSLAPTATPPDSPAPTATPTPTQLDAIVAPIAAASPPEAANEPSEPESAIKSAIDPAENGSQPDCHPDPAAEPETATEPPSPAAPWQAAFQSLNLQERFLNRLSALAARNEPAESTSLVPTKPTPMPSPPIEDDHLDDEIVVEDDPRSQPPARWRNSQPGDDLDSTLDRSNPLLLSVDQSVPCPHLQISTGELTAGQPVNVRVRLPDLLPRIFVKLWITDRQTRSLLDGPRWLVDFLPNGFDELEAFTQLSVPFGSVEIRFEAIAIEMHTQRESHKVSVDRAVIPPDLPVISLEEFQV